MIFIIIKKPKLPICNVTTMRPSLFCLNPRKTQKICDAYNRERDENNRKEWERYYNELRIYEEQRRKGMGVSDIIEGIVDMLGMSEMDIEEQDNVIVAALEEKKFRITVEEVEK